MKHLLSKVLLLGLCAFSIVPAAYCQWVQQPFPATEDLWKVRFIDSTTGWVLGANYLYKTTNGGGVVSVDENSSFIPSTSRLEQNYPNPFNPSTVIGFRVSGIGYGWVNLAVSDILGREVATLVNEWKAPGYYEVTFDASGLASGVYFYCLIAGQFVETRKLILMK